jgi:CheY-like chemotaxis protein
MAGCNWGIFPLKTIYYGYKFSRFTFKTEVGFKIIDQGKECKTWYDFRPCLYEINCMMRNYEYAIIIDDDTDLCVLLKAILKDLIPHVKFAHSIESGQKLLNQLKPDVIFLDNNLPDGQGVNRIEEIKSQSPDSLLVIITAAGFSREQSLKNGADLFLEKPFTYSNIFTALDNAGSTDKKPA